VPESSDPYVEVVHPNRLTALIDNAASPHHRFRRIPAPQSDPRPEVTPRDPSNTCGYAIRAADDGFSALRPARVLGNATGPT
jgi:hypothetical protein